MFSPVLLFVHNFGIVLPTFMQIRAKFHASRVTLTAKLEPEFNCYVIAGIT